MSLSRPASGRPVELPSSPTESWHFPPGITDDFGNPVPLRIHVTTPEAPRSRLSRLLARLRAALR